MPTNKVTLYEAKEICDFILALVGKMPRKVTLVGSGDGGNCKIPLGSHKTKILGVQIVGENVLVTFKEKVWGNTRHDAMVLDSQIIFSIPPAPGRGNDPEFVMTVK